MLVLAQVSDTHIDGGPRNTERAARVMDHVRGLPVDAVLITGDIAEHGAAVEYEIAREVLASPFPTVLCPGNHDDRARLREAFPDPSGTGRPDAPVNRALDLDGLSILLADSTVPGEIHGYLDDPTVAWLEEALAERRDVPTVIGMHHPAAPVGIPYVDRLSLWEPSRLEAVVRRNPQVVAVIAGHAHLAGATGFAGVPLTIAPATVNTALTPAESALEWPVDHDLPPGLALHVWTGSHLTTHARVCP
ncbi:metallophosphoesterase [Actinocorallia longicatena]|uniref:Metallophosphoesterase n=1 Tax=Actinocorallia longicatena TaxID=111803 RepID=A0ABP6Q9E0_9ACTN